MSSLLTSIVSAKVDRIERSEKSQTHRHLLLGEPARFAEPNRERHGDRSTPESTLLTATRDDRLEPDTWFATDVEATDALGAVDLVTRDREDVDLEVVDVDGNWGRNEMSAREGLSEMAIFAILTLADTLSSIRVEEDTLVLLDNFSNLLDRLDRPDLVVDEHDLRGMPSEKHNSRLNKRTTRTETRHVSGRIASSSCFRSMRPFSLTGR